MDKKSIEKVRRENIEKSKNYTKESGYQFVKEIEFDRLGVFTYSREEGTPAYNFPNQVHHMTKTSRMNKIMKLQKEVSLKKNSLIHL